MKNLIMIPLLLILSSCDTVNTNANIFSSKVVKSVPIVKCEKVSKLEIIRELGYAVIVEAMQTSDFKRSELMRCKSAGTIVLSSQELSVLTFNKYYFNNTLMPTEYCKDYYSNNTIEMNCSELESYLEN